MVFLDWNAFMGDTSKKWPQVAAVLSGSLLAVITGNCLGWSSPTVSKLLNNDMGFTVTENELSIIVMIAPLGYCIGSPIFGILLDKIGRKKTLLILAVPHILGWLLIATATSPTALYLGRIVSGISDGGIFTCLPIYFAEILEPKIRATLGVCHSTGIMTGLFLINVYGSFLSIRTTAYISICVPLLFITTFVWMPESPYFLLAKGSKRDAEMSLKQLRMMHNVDNELDQIDTGVKRQLSESCTYADIFKIRTNLKPFTILFVLRTFQQLAGITAVHNYLQVILERANTGLSPVISCIAVLLIQIVSSMLSGRFVDRFGRRPLLILSLSASAIVFIALGIFFLFVASDYDTRYFVWLPVTGLTLYFVMAAIGVMPIPLLMCGELLSVSVKSKALGIINIYAGFITSASSKLFQFLEYTFGMHTAFFVFSGFCVGGFLYAYYCAPETKGKTLDEIQQFFKNTSNTSTDDQRKNEEGIVKS